MSGPVTVREVGLRDGLQLVKRPLDTDKKLDWIRAQAATGFTEIEVTSFVPPALLPQFADAAEVLQGASVVAGLTASALVLNIRGAIRAIDAGARKITFVLSASEAHNQSNVRCSTDDSLAMFRELAAEIRTRDDIALAGAIATSFGCSIQGEVRESRVLLIAATMADAGAIEINLADTVGYAHPRQVTRIFDDVAREVGQVLLAAHFHDTRGLGLANVVAAFDSGVRRFDAALGGLGGCPFAPGASGNIATEDTVYLLECLGADTGVDIQALLDLRERMPIWLPSESLGGKLATAGLRPPLP